MGKKICKYDYELAARLEKIRDENGFTKEEMAHLLGVDVGTYKRYAYCTSKVPAEVVALLCDEMQLDLTYMMYGRDPSAYDFVKFWETVDQDKLADMYFEAARECRIRAKTRAKYHETKPRKSANTATDKESKVTGKNSKK